ncbi:MULTISPECIES: VPS10 domain-containing protein [Flavobacteriaceae]|uniref:VPS10 domain-containing protein n=1 Tax=Flavobacteriaceae TaxID=49546 RepID=UPI001491BCAA|nr:MULTISPECIES: glycosyl hydrolase [Allomuricauda]MDC6366403.1 glycosyl hydrolase [Muricauda sp. AC10]
MKKLLFICSFLILQTQIAQQTPTSKEVVLNGLRQKETMSNNSLVKNLVLKNIGPSVMSGRVVDLDVNPNDPTEFYVAYASGGVWHTSDNGISFSPILDSSDTQNVGDIAVDWINGIIWVGTGENNSSRSSYAGIGILKSTDKGKTWKNMGLHDSHHIGRILINPANPDEVVIGVTGHLYSPNEERGVYKTSDGGVTWQKTLFVNNTTGIIDVAYAPNNFNIQYAAAWQKDRKAWNFSGNGNASGIYKSVDGGNSWTLVTTSQSGFPTGGGVGRIGLAVFDENTVYAIHDSQFRRAKKVAVITDKLTKEDFKTMTAEVFLALDNKDLNDYLKTNGFQEKYRAENVKNMIKDGVIKPMDLAKYLETSNSLLFDTPVVGAEVYRSDDAGITWKKMNSNYIDDLFYSYGYYFAQISVDPSNKNKIYIAGVPLLSSSDGGNTFSSIGKENVHSDHHAIWVNPKRPGHLINGNDGGVNITYDDGQHWMKNNSTKVGQFYAINIDHEEPYNVYGGLQDNGVWKGTHNNEENSLWHQTGKNPWQQIMGGDGMQVQIDNRNSNIVYTGFQFGNYYRLDLENGKNKPIQPKHELGESPYRFNWQTPILLSEHNQDILYLGSNKLHRSLNQGNDWETISNDLSLGGKKGNVAYGTITTISESPFKFGLLYVGTDDGLVHISKNGGSSWENVSSSFPKNLWVSEVVASKHKKERVYVALNGYRWDDFTPYIYVSEDYGKSWKNISNTIPASPVNALVEDPENENLIFAGTDNGLYVSFNRGETWELFQNGMPNVAVHDLVIQPKAKHLLVGTHGRSIYKADIALLQQMTPKVLSKDLMVFDVDDIKHSTNWGNKGYTWGKPNTPGLDIHFYAAKAGLCTAKVMTANGTEVSTAELDADKGLNILSYDLAFSKKGKSNFLKKNKMKLTEAQDGKTYLPKGSYVVEVSGNGQTQKIKFKIE